MFHAPETTALAPTTSPARASSLVPPRPLFGVAAVLAFVSLASAQAQVDWVAPTRGVAIAVDAADNVFTVDFEQALGAEVTVTKRDVVGNLLWVSSIDQTDGTKWEAATWIGVDSGGSALVSANLMSGYSNPVHAASLLLKFAADGTPIFRIVYDGPFDGSSTRRLLLDEEDNVYVLGLGVGPAGLVATVKKFSSAGVPVWSWFDSNGIGRPNHFKFAPGGDLVLAGRGIIGSVNGYARIDRQGNEVWSFAGVPSLTVGDAAADSAGNTYLVHGEYAPGGGTMLKKLDPQGTLLWEQAYPPSGFRVEVGPDDHAIVSGFPDANTAGAAFFKVAPTGALVWSNLDADGPLALLLHAQMLLDKAGNAYLAAGTLFEMAVCKVRFDGTPAWTATAPGSFAQGMALGNTPGSLFVVGGRTARLLEPPVPIGASYCVGAPNSTGTGASLIVLGSAAVADDDVRLLASGLPANQPGLFYFGPSQVQLPFGDGFRCVGGPLHRVLPPATSGLSGTAQRLLDLGVAPAAGTIYPGATIHFQYWYRDPFGPGGSGSNLSDGYQVHFH